MTTENRYEGKPFLRLLDCYVLKAIGHLDDAQEAALMAMEPKFHDVYNVEGSWLEIVSHQMEFPASLPAEIKRIWDEGSVRAEKMGFSPVPSEFMREFVDTNFV